MQFLVLLSSNWLKLWLCILFLQGFCLFKLPKLSVSFYVAKYVWFHLMRQSVWWLKHGPREHNRRGFESWFFYLKIRALDKSSIPVTSLGKFWNELVCFLVIVKMKQWAKIHFSCLSILQRLDVMTLNFSFYSGVMCLGRRKIKLVSSPCHGLSCWD